MASYQFPFVASGSNELEGTRQGYTPNWPIDFDISTHPQVRDFASNINHINSTSRDAALPALAAIRGQPSNQPHHRPLPSAPSRLNSVHQNYQQSPTANDSQNRYLQELVAKLQNANAAQASQIVELRIKTAVLERDLEHASKARNSVDSSLGVIVGALTAANSLQLPRFVPPFSPLQHQPTPPVHMPVDEATTAKLREAEHEIEILRLKNQHLSKEVKAKHAQRQSQHTISPPPAELTLVKVEVAEHTKNVGKSGVSPITNDHAPPTLQIHAVETITSVLPVNTLVNASYAKPKAPSSPPAGANLYREVETNLPTLDDLVDDSEDDSEGALQRRQEREAYFNPPALTVHPAGCHGLNLGGDANTFENSEKAFRSGRYGGVRPQGQLCNEYALPSTEQRDPYRFGARTGTDCFAIMEQLPSGLQENPFQSISELNLAVSIHRSEVGRGAVELPRPDLFQYGLLYKPSSEAENVFRTVMITKLAKAVQLVDVVARVRGGDLNNATLCDTFVITGAMSARLEFRTERDALRYVKFCAENPAIFAALQERNNVPVNVQVVKSATYPSRPISQTRCLVIPAFPRLLSIRRLISDIACGNDIRAANLLSVWMNEERTLHLEFSNVKIAGSSYGILSRWPEYRDAGIRPQFDIDPCSAPAEYLLSGSLPQRDLFPNEQIAREYSEEKFRREISGYDECRRRQDARRRTEKLAFGINAAIPRRKIKSYQDLDAALGHDIALSYDSGSETDLAINTTQTSKTRQQVFASLMENESDVVENQGGSNKVSHSIVHGNEEAKGHVAQLISNSGTSSFVTSTSATNDQDNDDHGDGRKMDRKPAYSCDMLTGGRSGMHRPLTGLLLSKYAAFAPTFAHQATFIPNDEVSSSKSMILKAEGVTNSHITETSAVSSGAVPFDTPIARRLLKTAFRPRTVIKSASSPFASFNKMYGKTNVIDNVGLCQALGEVRTSDLTTPEGVPRPHSDSVTPEARRRQCAGSIGHHELSPAPSPARTIVYRASTTPNTSFTSDAGFSSSKTPAPGTFQSQTFNPEEIKLDSEADEEVYVKEVVMHGTPTPRQKRSPSRDKANTPACGNKSTVEECGTRQWL